jgi:hypothetical protein
LLDQVSMALGPGDWDSQLVTAACGGDMKYTDFRLVPAEAGQPPAQMGAWKSLRAEDRGPLSAFAAHPNAPLLATASLSQNAQASDANGQSLYHGHILPITKACRFQCHAHRLA